MPRITPLQYGSRCNCSMLNKTSLGEAERGNVPKKYRRLGYWAQRSLTSSLIDAAVAAAVAGGSQSSQGFAREITEVWILCAFMKVIL